MCWINRIELTGTTHSYVWLLHRYGCYGWVSVGNSTREFDMFVDMHSLMCMHLTATWPRLNAMKWEAGIFQSIQPGNRKGSWGVERWYRRTNNRAAQAVQWTEAAPGETSQPACNPSSSPVRVACSCTDWPRRGVVRTIRAAACLLPEGPAGRTRRTSSTRSRAAGLWLQSLSARVVI